MLGFTDLLARVGERGGGAGGVAGGAGGAEPDVKPAVNASSFAPSALGAPTPAGVGVGFSVTAPFTRSGVALSLLLLSAVFAYLWFAAGSSAGTLSRWAWYAAALAQGWLAILGIHGEAAAAREQGSRANGKAAKRFAMSPTGFLLAVALGAPLLHVTLFELLLHDADRGGIYTDATAWVGRAVAVAGLLAAGAFFVRQSRS